ncbi:MAG: glycosyltransferase family 1 protein [Actinomycetota bacterium]
MLAEAERRLGLDSRCVTIDPPPYGYDADEILGDRGVLLRELRRWKTLIRALRDVDVVHFNFGSSLLPRLPPRHRRAPWEAAFDLYARAVELRDLPLLRLAGKRIFVTYQGDDVRPTGAARGLSRAPAQLAADARKARAAAVFARYADGIYALNPDLLDYLPEQACFLPYASVDLDAWRPVGSPASSGPPVVVHAPTDAALKGTSALVAAVDRLRSDGLEVELVLVTGVSRAAARREFERADLGVDQLLSGWYGGVSVELMALGKPVVAHVRSDWLERIPAEMRAELPLIDATPATIESVLREWLTGPRAQLAEAGARGRAFVEAWHDPVRVAATVVADYERAVAT